jgi:hypothetical protein
MVSTYGAAMVELPLLKNLVMARKLTKDQLRALLKAELWLAKEMVDNMLYAIAKDADFPLAADGKDGLHLFHYAKNIYQLLNEVQ